MQAKHQKSIDPAATRARAERSIALSNVNQCPMNSDCDAVIRFGRFRVLGRQRQLIADGVPVKLGTRAFEILLVLLEADGSFVSKEELLSRGWPGIVVSEENLKVQVSALRKALGADRDVIRTEFGRGYRFTGFLRSNAAADVRLGPTHARLGCGRTLFPQYCRESLPVNRESLPV